MTMTAKQAQRRFNQSRLGANNLWLPGRLSAAARPLRIPWRHAVAERVVAWCNFQLFFL
jgi:hypothetical protein